MNQQWKNLISHDTHKISLGNVEILVNDGVFTFDSNLTYSTTQTLNFLKTLDLRNKKILDIGCGTGIIGISCLLNGAEKVTFSDVNQQAIENTLLNLENNNLLDKSEVINSDLFEKIHNKFDFIFANLPIANEIWLPKINKRTETLLEKFLEKVPTFMNKNGKVIFNWASFASLQELKNILEKFNYQYKLFEEKKLGHDWYIIEIQFN